ncbi:MAG: hypothetical protein ACOVNY_02500 [Chitinophagaceae bacterium]|jgi:hypothetical protein
MKKYLLAATIILIVASCKKEYKVQATYAKVAIAATWAKKEQFYSPKPQIYLESTGTWRNFISFSFTSDAEPDKIGFANPYVPGKGTNALYMNVLYSTNPGTTADSGYYNTTIPKCFQFIPKSADSTHVGTVVVLPQKVTLYRKDKTPFDVYISPATNPGTYNTQTGVFEIEVSFDESSFGGPKNIVRRYRFTS